MGLQTKFPLTIGHPRKVVMILGNFSQARNILNKFADIYSNLYKQHQHGTDLTELSNEISTEIGHQSLVDVDRVTPDFAKKNSQTNKRWKE